MRILDNWTEATGIPEGEVYVVDVNALGKAKEELPWSVQIAGNRSVAYFFERHDAIEYAEWLAEKVKK